MFSNSWTRKGPHVHQASIQLGHMDEILFNLFYQSQSPVPTTQFLLYFLLFFLVIQHVWYRENSFGVKKSKSKFQWGHFQLYYIYISKFKLLVWKKYNNVHLQNNFYFSIFILFIPPTLQWEVTSLEAPTSSVLRGHSQCSGDHAVTRIEPGSPACKVHTCLIQLSLQSMQYYLKDYYICSQSTPMTRRSS